MPELVIPPGFGKLTFLWHNGSTGRRCTTEVGVDLSTGVPAHESLVDAAVGFGAAIDSVLMTGSRFEGLQLIAGQDGGPALFDEAGVSVAGTLSGDACSPQVQVLARKTSNLVGRKFRGRNFFIQPRENHVGDGGTLDGTEITRFTEYVAAILGAISEMTGTVPGLDALVILHSDETVPTPVVSFEVQTMVATLRGRYPRS